MVTPATRAAAYDAAAGTPDPELPLVTIADLGIMRDVEVTADGVVVTITPTYSGCPAPLPRSQARRAGPAAAWPPAGPAALPALRVG